MGSVTHGAILLVPLFSPKISFSFELNSMGDMTQLGSIMAGVMFVWAIFRQWFPDEFHGYAELYVHKLIGYVYPYIHITFHEYLVEDFERSKAYASIERYLSTNSSNRAKRLKANVIKDCESVVPSMDDYEAVTDEFKGVTIWWTSSKTVPHQQSLFPFVIKRRGGFIGSRAIESIEISSPKSTLSMCLMKGRLLR